MRRSGQTSRPATSTCRTSRASSSTAMSARPPGARRPRPAPWVRSAACRGGRGRGDHLLERDAEAHDVADRLIHAARAAGQGAVGQAHRAVDQRDAERAPGAGSRSRALGPRDLAGAGQPHGVGDQHEARTRRRDREAQGVVGHVDQIGDDADDDVVAGEGGPTDGRFARGDRALRVPEVRHHRGSGVEPAVGGRGPGIGVPERRHHTARAEVLDELERPVELRGHGHHRDGSGREPLVAEPDVGVA